MKSTDFVAKGINISDTMIENSFFIYLEGKREFIQLDEIGSFIWGLINGTNRIEDIASHCADSFSGNPDEILGHVLEFTKLLEKESMVVTDSKIFKGVMRNE